MGKKKGANDGWGTVPTKQQQKKVTKEKKHDSKQQKQQKRREATLSLHSRAMQQWTHRTPADPDTSDWIAMQPRVIPCLDRLLSHYPRIVYLGFSFWRKLLILRPAESHLGYHADRILTNPNPHITTLLGPHDYPVCLGALGGLKYLDLPRCLLTPTPTIRSGVRTLYRETRPLSIALLDEFEGTPAEYRRADGRPNDVNLVAKRKSLADGMMEPPRPRSKHRDYVYGLDTDNNWSGRVEDHDCRPRFSSIDLFLNYAICNNQIDCVNVFLRDLCLKVDDAWLDGIRENAYYGDYYGSSLLQVAAEHSTPQMVQLFLDHGAQTDRLDRSNCSAVVYATRGGNLANLKLLLEAGCPVDCGQSHHSPLNMASDGGHVEMVELLLRHGALDSVNNSRHFHYSAIENSRSRHRQLVESRLRCESLGKPVPDPKEESRYAQIVELLSAYEEGEEK